MVLSLLLRTGGGVVGEGTRRFLEGRPEVLIEDSPKCVTRVDSP